MIVRCLLLGVVALPCVSCTYMKNRTRDLAEIFTLTVETKRVGVSLQVGPVRTGLSVGKGKGYGLRDGALIDYPFEEVNLLILGGHVYWREGKGKIGAPYAWCLPTTRMWDFPLGPWQKHAAVEAAAD